MIRMLHLLPSHLTRISIPAPVPMPAWTDSEVVRLLAISSPPASPLSLWSSPPPQIPFPSLPPILSPPSPLPSARRREDRPEVTLPPQKRLGIALGPRYEMSKIRELQAADRRRQTVILELLRIDHRRSTEITELRTALQGHVTARQGQVTALQAQVTTLQGQQGLAGGPIQSELPEEAGGSA
nr:hypothetical protein [Tanacetum cinerariifolium]